MLRSIVQFLFALQRFFPDDGLMVIERADDRECLGDRFGFSFLSLLERPARVRSTFCVGDRCRLPGVGGIRLVAVTEQRAGEVLAEKLAHVVMRP